MAYLLLKVGEVSYYGELVCKLIGAKGKMGD